MISHFIFKYLIFFSIVFSPLLAQDQKILIVGRVISQDGLGVPYANIFTEHGKATTSNRDGRFILNIDSDSTQIIIIQHSLFESDSVQVAMFNRPGIEIPLIRKTYQFNPVIVYGNLYGKESLDLPVNHRVIDFNSIPSSGISLGEKIDRFGIQLRDYGGPAGLKTISSPTGYSEHILITLDGFTLNSPQNGIFDMSSLPADFFSHGEFYPGQASSLYGSHAVGGTLNLLPAKPLSFLKLRSGSLGDRGASGEYSLGIGKADASFYLNHFESEGNFRENNRFRQSTGGTKLRFKNLAGWNLGGLIVSTETERGIPGSIQYPSPQAFKKNDDYFYLISGRTVSRWGQTALMVGAINSDEHYTNSDWAIDSRHNVENQQARLLHRIGHGGNSRNTVNLEYRKTKIKSDDAGNHAMVGFAAGVLTQFTIDDDITLSPSLRLDWDNHSKNSIATGNLAILWSSTISPLKSLTISSGTSYRTPTFNDLFWQDALGYSIGNPHLEPERGISTDFKINFIPILDDLIHVSANMANFRTENLIQWMPNEVWIYSPKNVLKSESTVRGLITTITPNNFPVHITLGMEKIDSRILSKGIDQGKKLLYVPPTSHWAEIQLKIGRTQLDLSVKNLGRRRYSYSDGAFLKLYRRLDSSLRHGFKLSGVKFTIEAGARNILDHMDLQSIYDYPEPGRTLFMILAVER